jgi:hypothetical protein
MRATVAPTLLLTNQAPLFYIYIYIYIRIFVEDIKNDKGTRKLYI